MKTLTIKQWRESKLSFKDFVKAGDVIDETMYNKIKFMGNIERNQAVNKITGIFEEIEQGYIFKGFEV
jgi:hypothetical protein